MLRLPHPRELEFSIELEPRTTPVYEVAYRMVASELKELNSPLQELLVNGFIRISSLPWRAAIVFVKKKDETLRMCIDY